MAFRVIDAIMPFMQVNVLLNQEIEALDRMVQALTPFMQVAQIWASEAIAHEQVLNNVLGLMNDPEFLVYHAFNVWSDRIQHNGQAALEWVGDEFLNLLNTYEQRYVAVNGRHSPIWERMQPKNVNPVMGSVDSQNYASVPPQFQPQFQPQSQFQPPAPPPMPPIPGNNAVGGGALDQLRQRIEMLKSGTPDLGMHLQRMHASQRQYMNADIGI